MDIFCEIIDGVMPAKTVYEDDYVKCIMDIDPASPGHVLVIPKTHVTDILEIDSTTVLKVYEAAKIVIRKMEDSLPNISGVISTVNYGEPQVVKHFHMHLIPTYENKIKPNLSQDEAHALLTK